MKCLSLWQPWASVIFEHDGSGNMVKPDETRGWFTNVREPVAIHAAKHDDRRIQEEYGPSLAALGLKWSSLPFGAIIGSVEIVDCLPAWKLEREPWQKFWGDYRQFGDDGKERFAFVLRNPIKFTEPIPWKGKQGFFEVNL